MAPGSGDAAVPGANLALNKPVTASSALPQHPGAYLTDGRLDLMWSTSDTGWQSSPLADEWAMVDLGAVQPIMRWTVYHGAAGTWATKDFQLEYSTGDASGPWQTADSVVGNMDAVTDRTLPDAISARYVRLHVTKKTAEGVDWLSRTGQRAGTVLEGRGRSRIDGRSAVRHRAAGHPSEAVQLSRHGSHLLHDGRNGSGDIRDPASIYRTDFGRIRPEHKSGCRR